MAVLAARFAFCAVTGYMERFNKSLAREAVSEYVGVAEKHGMTATELAIGWVKSRPFVTSTIIGSTSMDQLKVRILSLAANSCTS